MLGIDRAATRRRRGLTAVLVALVVLLAVVSVVGLVSYVPAQRSAITRAVFIGDSYTHGAGASSPARRWTSLVAASRGWEEVNLGLGGTGYLATAGVKGCGRPFCPNYESVALDVINEKPDVVVVAGGQNDYAKMGSEPENVVTAVTETYRRLRTALPNAQLIGVGPSTTGRVDKSVRDLDRAVQRAGAGVGMVYISLIDPKPVITPSMVLPDGGHVDDQGHRAIADRVLAALD